ncbi:hypothetical protein HZR84_01780 [Hyphobacterium sp. CCMP332]|nr:hypothetical protein HZR84_01780 [Hyphobacterium sp. CCMP332]
MKSTKELFFAIPKYMRHLYFFLISIFLISCDSKEEPDFSFELTQWKKDKNACEGFRSSNKSELVNSKEVFLRWPERQVNSFFGRPDRHRLSKRHQKFYVYFLEEGKQCDQSIDEYGEFLQLRFDATGYVNEIEIRNDFEQLID